MYNDVDSHLWHLDSRISTPQNYRKSALHKSSIDDFVILFFHCCNGINRIPSTKQHIKSLLLRLYINSWRIIRRGRLRTRFLSIFPKTFFQNNWLRQLVIISTIFEKHIVCNLALVKYTKYSHMCIRLKQI